MNYKPRFHFGATEEQTNAQVFATFSEAHDSARDRFARWTMPSGFDVVETSDDVNYRWDDKKGDVSI